VTEPSVVSIDTVAASIDEPFTSRDLVSFNDSVVRVARAKGEFVWHHHDEDEVFVCWDGQLTIDLASEASVSLQRGQCFVVPAGVQHRPRSDHAVVLLVERSSTTHGDEPDPSGRRTS